LQIRERAIVVSRSRLSPEGISGSCVLPQLGWFDLPARCLT
jgi:hypothetical protein